jgi:hypothetical protein
VWSLQFFVVKSEDSNVAKLKHRLARYDSTKECPYEDTPQPNPLQFFLVLPACHPLDGASGPGCTT